MLYYDGIDATSTRFQSYDWRLQVILVAWSVGVALLILAIHLMTANARLLSILP
ncbi:MAG TPA: hypothetical protein VNN19_02915 [bacterium]|nr:hypothetical protein [bacterium]